MAATVDVAAALAPIPKHARKLTLVTRLESFISAICRVEDYEKGKVGAASKGKTI
jgi:hypothetical protein